MSCFLFVSELISFVVPKQISQSQKLIQWYYWWGSTDKLLASHCRSSLQSSKKKNRRNFKEHVKKEKDDFRTDSVAAEWKLVWMLNGINSLCKEKTNFTNKGSDTWMKRHHAWLSRTPLVVRKQKKNTTVHSMFVIQALFMDCQRVAIIECTICSDWRKAMNVNAQWPWKNACRKARLYALREREEWKQPSSFGPSSPLDIVAQTSRFVSDSWPQERLQRNDKTDQRQSSWKDRKGLICTRAFFYPLFEEAGRRGTQGIQLRKYSYLTRQYRDYASGR